MGMWLTIAAAIAVAGMGWDLALRFGSDRIPVHAAQLVDAVPLVSREEPAA